MTLAYELFQSPNQNHQARDSSLILCFRELWERIAHGSEPTELDLRQIDHMAHWLQGKVQMYQETPPSMQQLQPLLETAQQGWELILEGVACLADFLELGQPELLEEARNLSEEGEAMLKELEEGIVASRDEDALCDAYIG
ncbi:MAG: hypothetical protein AMXMBFR33_21770 [Candidatus Xenobia bacterium]